MAFFVPLAYPVATRNVSDSFADHVARGSVNPGTDYTAPYGSEVVSVNDGYVADVVLTNYGSGGRMIYVDHDDGSGVDYLHLSRIDVKKGDRVRRKQHLGYSGASGYGDEHYYGAHLHISIRNRHGYHAMNAGNYDFDASIKAQWDTAGWATDGGSTPISNEEDTMAVLSDADAQRLVARVDMMWGWMGGGTNATEFYLIKQKLDAIGVGITRATTTNLYRAPNSSIAAADVTTGFWREFTSQTDLQTFLTLGIVDPDEPIQSVSADTYNGIKGECRKTALQIAAFQKGTA